jgi:hypothetical protein
MKNRKVKYNVNLYSQSFIWVPFEEYVRIGGAEGRVSHRQTNTSVRTWFSQHMHSEIMFDVSTEGRGLWTGPAATFDNVQWSNFTAGIYHMDDQWSYNVLGFVKNAPTSRVGGDPLVDVTNGFVNLDEGTEFRLNPTDEFIRYKYNEVPRGTDEAIHNDLRNSGSTIFGWTDSMNPWNFKDYGYRIACMVWQAKWFDIVYFMYDKSGRHVEVSTAYDITTGIGVPPFDDSGGSIGSPFFDRILIRAHWVPRSEDSDLNHPGAFAPDYSWIHGSDRDHMAFTRCVIPDPPAGDPSGSAWTGAATDPNGEVVVHHFPVVMVTDIAAFLAAGNMDYDTFFSQTEFRDKFTNYLVYLWPIHTYHYIGDMGVNKANWVKDSPDTSRLRENHDEQAMSFAEMQLPEIDLQNG